MTHICVPKITMIGSDNGLSPGRRQAIIWTNAEILLIGPLGTNIREILSEIYTFSFKKMHLKMSSGKWQPSCILSRPQCVKKHCLLWSKPTVQTDETTMGSWVSHCMALQLVVMEATLSVARACIIMVMDTKWDWTKAWPHTNRLAVHVAGRRPIDFLTIHCTYMYHNHWKLEDL